MIKEAEGQSQLQNLLIDDEISAMNSNLELLRSFRKNIENEEEISHEEIMNNQETIRGIIENINVNLSGERSFKYLVIPMGGSSAEEFLGDIIREITISMPDLRKQMNEQLIPRTITMASELKFAGKVEFFIKKHIILSKKFHCRLTICLDRNYCK